MNQNESGNVAPETEKASMKEVVERYLDFWKIKYTFEPGNNTYYFDCEPRFVTCESMLTCIEEHGYLIYRILVPAQVPRERMLHLVEYFNRINLNIYIGSFVLDMNTGYSCLRMSMDIEGMQLSDLALKNMLLGGAKLIDRYLNGLFKVAFNDGDPAEVASSILSQ